MNEHHDPTRCHEWVLRFDKLSGSWILGTPLASRTFTQSSPPKTTACMNGAGNWREARTLLAERESELAQFRAVLAAFESRYFRQVGQLYAELDELEARIAEREAELYGSDAARERAEEARARAHESHEAAFGEDREAEVLDPPPSLKTLFRELAKRIHPDFARDEAEQKHFTLLMARAKP